ncbi:MAG: site-2 protease family protein [Polyangiaceae bacterium]
MNVAWGIVNLLPVLPLDGGHVLESLATGIAGPRGRRVAHAISLLLAVSAAGFAFYSRQIWLGILALWCVSISWQRWSAPAAKPVASPAVPPWVGEGVDEAWRLLFRGDAEEATKSAAALVARIPDGPEHAAARTMALEVLAWAHIEAGDEGAALEVAKQMPQPSSELLKARLLVAEGKLAEGLARLEELAQQGGADFPVLVLSSVYVREQRPDFVLKLLRAKRPEPLSPQTQLVLTAQLFHSGYLEACLEACELGFESTQQGVFAYNAACACSRLGRVDAGIEWLERAVTSGFADAAQLDADDDIAALRADPRFQEIRTRLGPAPVQPNP